MKIAEYVGIFGTGGIEHVVKQLFTYMNHDTNDVDFIIDYQQVVPFEEEINSNNGRIVSLLKEDLMHVRKIHKFSRMIKFYLLMRQEKYDIVHFHISYPSTLIYCLLAKLAGIKVRIVQCHSSAYGSAGWLQIFISELSKKLFAPCATDYLAVSSMAGEWMFGNRKYDVLTNGVDVERFRYSDLKRRELRNQYGITMETFVLGHVGRFSYQKNQIFLIDVFSEVVKLKPNSLLMLVGEGSLKEKIEEKSRCMGVADKVMWMPFSPNVEDYYHIMDAFVFPSRYEGFGIAVLEAQITGLPVWISDRVPKEACVMSTVNVESLEWNARRWAKDIVEEASDYVRVDQAETALAMGYDIREKSKWLEKYYSELLTREKMV